MDKDVLVLSLDHVVALGPEAGHVTVDINRLLLLHSLQHGVDDNECASPAHTRAVANNKKLSSSIQEQRK
jgi:hypothetical protein